MRQHVQWYWKYALPIKASRGGFIFNGWAADGMFNLASGQPYTIHYLYEGDYNGSGEYFGRLDLIGNPHQGTGGVNLLNLSAFALPCGVFLQRPAESASAGGEPELPPACRIV